MYPYIVFLRCYKPADVDVFKYVNFWFFRLHSRQKPVGRSTPGTTNGLFNVAIPLIATSFTCLAVTKVYDGSHLITLLPHFFLFPSPNLRPQSLHKYCCLFSLPDQTKPAFTTFLLPHSGHFICVYIPYF